MTLQDIEIAKLHDRIIHDVTHLINKYQKIMDWDVPENDAAAATKVIVKEIRAALDKIESQA